MLSVLGQVEQQADATALDVVTLVVAIAGAVTGILALVVQAVFFRRSGPHVRAELLWAWMHSSGRGSLTKPISAPITGPPEPGYGSLMLAVKVRNRGRAATTIERVEIDVSGIVTYFEPKPLVGPGHDQRLEAESSDTWYINAQPVLAAAEALEVEPRIRAVVTLGSGRQHRTPRVTLR